MAVNTVEINAVYDSLEAKVTETINGYFDSHDLTGEDKATVMASAINTLISSAVNSVLQQEQMDVDNQTKNELRALQVAQANRDVLLKEKMIETEEAKKNDIVEGIALKTQMRPIQVGLAQKEDTLKEKQISGAQLQLDERAQKFPKELAQMDVQKASLERNIRKMESEIALTDQQRNTMSNQEADNRRIKVLNALGDTFGTGMAGGLDVGSEAWKYYFTLAVNTAKGLDANATVSSTANLSGGASVSVVS
jgi:vacuolar-type H+-ATPase subunit I/STV1